MNKFTVIMFCGCVAALTGCNPGDDLDKGVIDTDELEATGGDVQLSGSTGTVTVPFLEAVPDADDEDLEDELADSVELFLQSKLTGTTVTLAIGMGSGELVNGTPNDAGEFSWDLNNDRDEATLTFYNETVDGITLKDDREYEAEFTVNENEYVEEVETISFDVAPE